MTINSVLSLPLRFNPLPCDAYALGEEIRRELNAFSPLVLPRHVAIIPDGNRRWSKKHGKPFYAGYLQGAFTLIRTAFLAKELHIPVVTVFSFSTENWKRSPREQAFLWELFIAHLKWYEQQLIESGIRIDTIGHIDALPKPLQETLIEVKKATSHGSELTLVLALNYGGRDELVRTCQKLIQLKMSGQISDIDETTITSHLDTHLWPDPDLLIRTGGEQRLSNFLLWQSSYSELYIDPDFWPDFTTKNFIQALHVFQNRSRRHGGGEA